MKAFLASAVPEDIAEALRTAHAADILHRDVKPGNVLVRRTASGWEVKGRLRAVIAT